MNNELYLASYLLALSNNTMTNEIRQNFIDGVDYANEEECKRIFVSVLKAILDSVAKEKTYTIEDAKILAKNEISALNLISLCGNEDVFVELVDLLISVTEDKIVENIEEHNMTVCKSFIDVADNMTDDFKYDIYVTILRFIVAKFYILNDKEFTSKLVSYIDSIRDNEANISYTGLLSSVVLYVLHKGYEE